MIRKITTPRFQKRRMIKVLKDCFEETPFEFIVPASTYSSTKKALKREEGYIYISQSSFVLDNVNFKSTWIFKDHNKKTVYAFDTVNIGLTQVLADIGITTF